MKQNTRLMLDHNVSLLTYLRKAAESTKAGITFIQSADEEVKLSYSKLYELSQYCLHNLSVRGVRKGDQLIIQTDNNRLFLIVFWACLLGGIIPIPLSSGDREEHRQKLSRILNGLPRPSLATSRNELQQLELVIENFDLNQEVSSRFFIIDDLIEKVSKATAEPIQLDHLAYIQYSSGSTGDPKGVSLTHQNLIINASDIIERCKTTSSDISLSWMPLSHDMGLICFHLGGLIAGLEQLLMPTQLFVRRPVLWLEKANQHRVTQLYSPNFGYQYFLSSFDASLASSWDLSSVRYIINGAEPISWELCQRFIDTLMPFGLGEDTIYPGYGLAEASVAVALPDPGDKIKVHKLSRNALQIGQLVEATDDEGLVVSFVETGYPIRNCEVRILDEGGNEVEDKVIGKIMIRGGNVTSGYYLNPKATSKLIKEDGWVETGDLGFFISGRLVITGRAKNMIIISGQNYYPQDIERVAETEFPDLQGGKVVACAGRNELDGREELLVFFQYRGKPNTCVELVKGIRQAILERIGLGVEAVIPVRQIPRTTSGKVQHFKLTNRYNDGEFNDLLSELQQVGDFHFPSDPIEQLALLETIWKEISELDLGTQSDGFIPAGATSLTITRFLNRVYERTGLKLDFQNIIKASSFSDLSRTISRNKFDHLPEIKSSSIQEYYPLSSGQKRFWAINQIDNSGIALNLCNVSSILGEFDINCLKKAVNTIVDRYEILRTSFHFVDDEPVQKVHSVSDLSFQIKYEDLTANQYGSETAEIIASEIINSQFDLTTGPLFRIHIMKTGEKQFTQVFVMHHLISDGWSVGLFVEELGELYKAFVKNEEVSLSQPKIQYRDYVLWKKEVLETDRLLPQKRYWHEILDGAEPEIDWPLEGNEQYGDFEGEEIGFSLGKPLTRDINDICSRYAVTPFTVLYVGLQVLIARYTRKKDLLIGTSAAGRTHHSIENQLGYFISTLPLRMQVNGNESFEILLQRAHQVLLDALSNQDFPVDLLDDSLATKATDFEVLLLYQNLEKPFHFENAWEDLEVKTLSLRNTSSLVNMEWEFEDIEEGLFCRLRYKKRRFEHMFMAQISRHFVQVLQTLIQNPSEQVSRVRYLSKEEEDLLIKFRTGPQASKAFSPIIQQFERQAKAAPSSCAITFNDASFTYAEIDKKASKIANYLSNTCGINHGARVGVFISRSVEMIATLLGIHKTGAAYVPLDTEWPIERLRFVLEDSNANLVLTKEDLLSGLNKVSTEVIELAGILSSSASELWNISPEEISGEAAAYIMYTSGTTGTPKGVVISQDNLADYVNTFSSWFKLSSRDVVIQQSSIAFDVSVEEIFPVLVEGGELVVVEDGGRNIDALVQHVRRYHATIISTTPLIINELNKTHAWSEMADLRLLISGGDVLQSGYISEVPDRISVYNTYGPTETTVCVTYQRIERPEDCLLVGSPISNHTVYLLDENLQEVPPGVAGEICVAGKGVAHGYINRPKETAEKFISPSSSINNRVYRTGDLGVWTDDGKIIFKGRKDDQIKWRGYRIEPAEIANRIVSIEGVTNALVVIREINEERFLVAYFIAEHALQPVNLRKHLEEYFPPYLVPTHFVQISKFPLNSNGKPDKKLLPLPDDLSIENKELIKPKSETEKVVLDIWREVLNKKQIGTTDNFFQIGGHSLKAAKIASRIKEKFCVDFSLKEVFRFLTVVDMSNFIGQLGAKELTKVAVAGDRNHYPLSLSQRRLWVLDNFKYLKVANNLSWSFRIDKENLPLLKKAIDFIISRHASLRTTFKTVKGEPAQLIHPPYKLKFEIPVVLTCDTEASESKYQLARHTFELDRWPLFRFVALDRGGDDYEIVSTFHHIITDGYSMENFLKELDVCLESLVNEQEIILPKLDIQYHDFAVWEQKWLNGRESSKQRKFWLYQLSGTLPVLQLPLLETRPAVSKNEGKVFRQILPQKLIEQLQLMAKEEEVSFFSMLCSILKLLLYRYSGQSDFIIGTATAKRNLRELELQIGYYLNMLPLRTSFVPENSFLDLLKQVSVTNLEALQNENYPIDKLIEELTLQRDTGRSALFDVIFILQNFDHEGLNELKFKSGYFNDFQEIDNGTSLVDLHVEINCIQGHWTLKVRYNTEIFEEKQIVNFSQHYINLAKAVVSDRSRPLFTYDFMSETEGRLLELYSVGPLLQVKDATINEYFAQTIIEHSEKIALRCGENSLTYKSLDEAAQQVANYLLESDLSSGDVVGILMNRSEKTIVAILGVLRAGAIYLPLEPEYPLSRLEYMLEDSGANFFIVEDQGKISTFEGRPRKAKMLKWMDISDFQSEKSHNIDAVQPYDPAYIMYTSGSTGRPKGVKVLHSSLTDYCQTFNDYFGVDSSDIVVQQSSLAFDVSIEEIFPILCVGGTIAVAEEGGRDITALLRIIREDQTTILSTTPGVIRELNSTEHMPSLESLRILISGGDRLDKSYIDKLISGISIYNTYGPTEVTVCASYHQVSELENTGLIGKPTPNHSIYLLDEHNQKVSFGIKGEICVTGPGIAQGYLNKPELTNSKFVRLPDSHSEVVFKTGDIGVWREDGMLQFVGRNDDQLKINGYRVETNEVANTLKRYIGITEVIVIPRESNGKHVLIAYLQGEGDVDLSNLRMWMFDQLPFYMVPAYLTLVDSFEITTNGKIDLKALPEISLETESTEDIRLPSTSVQQVIAGMWADVLKIAEVSLDDNFFQLGGNSIKATQIISRVNKRYQIDLGLEELFVATSLDHFVKNIIEYAGEQMAEIKLLEQQTDYPLSYAQQRMWILHELAENKSAYNVFWAYKLEGELNIKRLESSIHKLTERHGILRTSFEARNGVPRQVVSKNSHPEIFHFTDLTLRGINIKDDLNTILQSERNREFDLQRAPLARFLLIRTGENEHVLSINTHHILTDGWSMTVLAKDLGFLYQEDSDSAGSLPTLDHTYTDFSAFHNLLLQDGTKRAAKKYWMAQFSEEAPLLHLATDYPRPAVRKGKGEVSRMQISEALVQQLEDLSRFMSTSTFVVLLANLKVLLSRYTGQTDIVIGIPVSGRTFADQDHQVGLYVNTLPIRVRFSQEDSFTNILENVRKIVVKGIQHQDYPFDKLVDDLQQERDLSRNPLFDVMLAMQQSPVTHLPNELSDRLKVSSFPLDSCSSKFDLNLNVFEENGELELVLEYDSALFRPKTAERLLLHFTNLLSEVLENPDCPVNTINFLSENEKHYLLDELGRGETIDFDFKTPLQLIKGKTKEPAVLLEDRKVSYKELIEKVDLTAKALHLTYDVEHGDRVGVLLDRNEHMLATILAILKCGGTYVPIDPEYPLTRIEYLINDSNVKFVITQEEYVNIIEESVRPVVLEELYEGVNEDADTFPEITIRPDQIAYIIYTSGSTGNPKGVAITYANLSSFLQWARYEFEAQTFDITYAASSYCFDLSIFELFFPLTIGKKVRILNSGLSISDYLLVDQKVLLNTVPSVVTYLIDRGTDFSNVSVLNMAGEAVPLKLKAHFSGSNIRVNNLYGPSEYTTYTSMFRFDDHIEGVPIGGPIANTQVYVLDANRNLQATGCVGEIAVSGAGIASGYINRLERTSDSFIEDPFIQGATMYLTGDLGKWRPDGNIEFLGRKDHQVKVRGYRIEPGEIEEAIKSVEGVDQAVVLTQLSGKNETTLVAYYTSKTLVSFEFVTDKIKRSLPSYMVPSTIILIEKFPLNPNGKIDRKKLPLVATNTEGTEVVAPRNESEHKLFDIWGTILGTREFGITQNFFSIGGHSLHAARIVHHIQEDFQVALKLKDVFLHPTIEQLLAKIRQADKQEIQPIPLVAEGESYELSGAQHRLWILHQLEASNAAHAYHVSGTYKIKGDLDLDILQRAYGILMERHEILRTVFKLVEGAPGQVIIPFEEDHSVITLERLPATVTIGRVIQEILAEQKKPFNLEAGPLMRLKAFKYQEDEHYLSVTLHHIICDGWSLSNMMQEVTASYMALVQSENPVLSPLPIQYKDYAAWSNSKLNTKSAKKDKEYWKQQLQGELPVLDLPTDFPRPSGKTYHGDEVVVHLKPACREEINKVSDELQVSPFVLFSSILNLLFYQYTGQKENILGTAMNGRLHPDLVNLSGLFVNTIPLRISNDDQLPLMDHIKLVNGIIQDAWQHQSYPFDRLVDEMDLHRDLSRSPVFDVMLLHEDDFTSESSLENISDFRVYEERLNHQTSKFDLTITFVTSDDSDWHVRLEYNTDLFLEGRIIRMAHHLECLMENLSSSLLVKLPSINYLTKEEERYLKEELGKGEKVTVPEKTIIQLFEEQAWANQNAIAVRFEGDSMTYGTLNERADRVASALRSRYQLRPGDRVGMILERSMDVPVTILGILKSGCTYVPIDPTYPDQRKEFILKDSQVQLVLVDEKASQAMSVENVVTLDELEATPPQKPDARIGSSADVAYVIYTSGTSGQPKGVEVTHASVVNLCFWIKELIYDVNDRPLVSMLTASVAFDSSVKQLFPTLLYGGTLVLVSNKKRKDPAELEKELIRHDVDLIDMTPGYLGLFLDHIADRLLPLKYMLAGGEALGSDLVNRFYQCSKNSQLLNVYGVTEATVDSTFYLTKPTTSPTVPIGEPIPNTEVIILDDHQHPKALGYTGEICIAGEGLAKGYLNREDLTNERFIAHPFRSGEKIYRTGDLGRWDENGSLFYVGRADRQVKIRGYRIELQEIEHHLSNHPLILECTVIATNGELEAYILPDGVQDINVIAMKNDLGAFLPDYMVPSRIIAIDRIPLNAHGKVDVEALKDSGQTLSITTAAVNALPDTDEEKALVEIWKDQLQLERIGIEDNFFELGGHSLKAILVANQVKQSMGVILAPTDLFRYPTIRQLAHKIEQENRLKGEQEENQTDSIFEETIL